MNKLTHDSYTVGWICALPIEMAAAKLMLDQNHPILPKFQKGDHNSYTFGEIAGHNVVIACLPGGIYGTTSAAIVAQQMLMSFTKIRFGLMVGVGGGVPSTSNDIRLGDIVVSKPTQRHGGVIQYDYGKTMADGKFHRTGSLNRIPQCLLTAMANLESDHQVGKNSIPALVSDALRKSPNVQSTFSSQVPRKISYFLPPTTTKAFFQIVQVAIKAWRFAGLYGILTPHKSTTVSSPLAIK